MIYLDNSATTFPDPDVLASFQKVSEKIVGNPSSLHVLGGQAEKLLQTAREQVANILGVHSSEVIFTSGGTEANNMAIKGIAFAHSNRGKHIITSVVEHPSVLEACSSLEKMGFEVTYIKVNQDGVVDLEELRQAIRPDTILISIMHVNNELGSIQPIEKIGNIARQHPKIYFHVDDIQGFGKTYLDLKGSHVDICSLSGHKIHGLKGTGILYVRKGIHLWSLHHGGSQEHGSRSGTENVAGNVAIAKAMRLIKDKETYKANHLQDLNQCLRVGLSGIKQVKINTPLGAAPHILNISIPGTKPEVIVHALGEHDIFLSTTSACSSKIKSESAVLTACGFSKEQSETSLRISLSYSTTKTELETFLGILSDVIKQLLN